jgi:hypothetical protein
MARKLKTFAIHTLIGSGFTQTEARADALAKAEHALEATSQGPKAIVFRGEVWLVIPDAHGTWGYARIQHQTHRGYRFLGHNAPTCEEAERLARQHLAQWTHRTDDLDLESAEIIEEPDDRHEHIRWARWQHRYALARSDGADDTRAREIADAA